MAEVTYDGRSFLVDGNRIWLVSGSVHYFRTPAALWPDRLLKAKRAGLNCISTCIAWNFHEPQEGQWHFEGDRDVETFVRLAGDLGLYVILRPGPYIGAEWDFGGLPGWLATKSGMAYRTSSAAYTHYYDKYFGRVLPRLAEHQVTRGGNIILIQNEHEYLMTTMPDRLSYLEFVSQLLRRSGFDVPIITCNGLSSPPVPDTVECVNAWDQAVVMLKRLRQRQPRGPALVTEFRCGQRDHWGGEHRPRDGREVARRALEILGCGAQYNYSMWHGGTNFGFWGGRRADSDAWCQTTSFDCDAPLPEGGGLTDTYYLMRLVNLCAQHMGPFWAAARMEAPGVRIHDSTDVLNCSGPTGRWAVVTNNGREDITTARISLPGGKYLTVSLHPLGATAVPVNLSLTPKHKLNYANVMPLGLFRESLLLLHGPVGWDARVAINGKELRAEVPKGAEPKVLDHQDLTIVLVSSELGMRTWLAEDTLVFGADYVGDSLDDIVRGRGMTQCALLPLEGKPTHRKVPAEKAPSLRPPRLGAWKRVSVCTEPVADDLEWEKIDRPRDLDRLGVPYGYAWYRVEVQEDRPRTRHLFLPDCEDRATVYVNGELAGIWGRGEDARRVPMSAAFRRGPNVITALLDNLGRNSDGLRLGGLKGLFGHIYEAKPFRPGKFRLKEAPGFARRIVPRNLGHLLKELEGLPVWSADLTVSLPQILPVHLSFTDVPHHVAVLCNDRARGFFPRAERNYGDVTLAGGLKKGRNSLQLLLWGDLTAKVLDNVKLHLLTEPLSGGATWSYRRWEMPTPGGPIVGKDQPAWYSARFKYAETPVPLFVHIVGARKGQIFLNKHNVGRFWTIGPQQYYYLPECWLADENELLLFVELGDMPRRTRLEFRPRGPFRD